MRYLSLIFVYVIRDFKRGRTVFFMVVIGLAIASASVMTTSGVLLGFESMLERGARGWIGDLIIVPPNDSSSIDHSAEILADVKSLQYVQDASLRSSGSGVLKYKERFAYPSSIYGLQIAAETNVTGLPKMPINGAFLDSQKDANSIILGINTADGLVGGAYDGEKIPVGASLQLMTKEGTYKEYLVKGIIDAKTFSPNYAAFLQKDELEKVILSQNNNIIIIKLADPSQLEQTKLIIQSRHPDIIVHTWQEEAGYVEDILQAVRSITLLIISLLVFSVFIIISIVIFINITQEKRQIGIMKSMGARTNFIISIYVFESLFYFILAYFCGFLLFLLVHNYSIRHPAPMPVGDFYTVLSQTSLLRYFLILLFASLIGGFIPSYLITKNKIIDTLRNI